MKNIVLLTVDCLRYDRCGFNGHHRPTTPTLDKLATESVVFDFAYSTGPYTTESFPGILAGQHSYNGSYFGGDPAWKALDRDSETLATFLKDTGYDTIATLTNPHLTSDRNFDLGFDSFQNLRTQGEDAVSGDDNGDDSNGLASRMYDIRDKMRSQSSTINPYTLPFIAYRYYQSATDWPTVAAKEVLEKFEDDIGEASGPFFGWTHLMDLHAPIDPRRVNEGGLAPSKSKFRQFKWDSSRAANIHEPRYDTLYDSALRYIDNQISDFISKLKEEGEWENTILIVTGDHGEALFDRGFYGHPRHNLYGEALHMPLLVRAPSLSPERIDTQFSLAWIHELIGELIEQKSGTFPSYSGVDWFADEEPEPSVVVSDTLDRDGHSVSVRNHENVVILSEVNKEDGSALKYFDKMVEIAYKGDKGERTINISENGELIDYGKTILTEESTLNEVEGRFSQEMEERLQDLGYKM